MQGQQPREQGQAGRRRQQQPDAPTLAQPQPGQVTAHDLGQRGQQEQGECLHAFSAALARCHKPSCASRSIVANVLPWASACASIERKRRSNL
ncbi:hypothetical protein G6F31_018525 [Rhizopus arrhizus]|nr:hypothetical protein G6F31_018525 [Rhizopus arrhizus]KAG1385830.1 hypothetical protein G6F59_017177 [Rhizopus arrhizus]